MKVNSHVTREFGLSNLTKIQEHTHVAACECQLRRELYRMWLANYVANYLILDFTSC